MHEQHDTPKTRTPQALTTALGLVVPALAKSANEPVYSSGGWTDMFEHHVEGARTPPLTRIAGRFFQLGLSMEPVVSICAAWNEKNIPPLKAQELRDTVAGIYRTHGRNHPGTVIETGPLFDFSQMSVERFFEKEAPAHDWVLEDCLPLGKTALLVGPGGTGKSQLALQLAFDIAMGIQCFSPWKPGTAGKVLILSSEDDEHELHRRVSRLLNALPNNANAAEYRNSLAANLFVAPRVGEDNLLTRVDDHVLQRTAMVERLIATVEPGRPLRAIVIDPVARFRGGDENSAADTTRFIEAIEALVKGTGASIIAVHHANKNSINGAEQNQTAARGSSALTDGVRLQINLALPTPTENKHLLADAPGKYVVAKITKTNYSAAGGPKFLRKEDNGRLTPVDLDQICQTHGEAQMAQLCTLVTNEAEAGRSHSKSSLATRFGGREGLFGKGQGSLKQLVDKAIVKGMLVVGAGKAKALSIPSRVGKAKLNLTSVKP